ncbi:MAG: ABC transporter permease [Reichenbachiella sp.]|uniref:ABC transporter permease n=1 Tax=Reichenbachiella sp. TaxID=2184521 RepID=UPI003265F179
MEQWLSRPWFEMMMASTLLMGAILCLFLLFNKYPSSRFLGQLVIAYLSLFVCKALVIGPWFHLSMIFVGISFNWFARALFTQNSRIKSKYWWFLIFVILVASSAYLFNQNWLIRSLSTGAVAGLLIDLFRIVRAESDHRGISWFQSPGSRLIWFRNYLVYNFLLLLLLMAFGNYFELWMLGLAVGFNFMIVYYQVFRESSFTTPIPVANKYKKSTLSAAQKASILERLDELMTSSKFYLNDDASLSSLAELLHTTTHHLSQVLNESKGISFQELISQNRIREARYLLKDQSMAQTKVENIAAMVGYNSKSAFNTAFKRLTGLTPSEYRDTKDVRSYREEPLPDKKRPSTTDRTFSLSYQFTNKLKRNMVVNFFKTFIRTLSRNKVFTLINLLGLTVGFACSMLIYLYIQDELSFDRAIPNNENIYRISWIGDPPQTRTPHPMAQAMKRDFSEVVESVSLSPWYGAGLIKQDISVENPVTNIAFEEPNFFFADSTFFKVFQMKIIAGDKDALKEPNTLVITQELANKYFGDDNPIGKVLEVSDMPMEVSAVVAGMPKSSHFHFNALISYVTVKHINPESYWMTWADFGHFNYIVLNEGVSFQDVESKIPDWALDYLNWGADAKIAFDNGTMAFKLQSITDIHLYSHLRWELENNGNVLYVYILMGTMIFILVIAGINYVNLTTAKSVERAKEIGVRKTLGAVSFNLTVQFYLESILFCLIALGISLGLTTMLLDPFNHLSSKSFTIADLMNLGFITKASLLSLMVGLIAGFYPAIFLSSFRPSEVMKGKVSGGGGNSRLRSLLVVCQFIVSAILIASSLIILRQIDYMQSKELGFDQTAVISLPIISSVEHGGIDLSEARTIQNELRTIPGVKAVSAASNMPGSQFNNHPVSTRKDPTNRTSASEIFVDFDLLELFEFQLLEGRTFDHSFSADSAGTNVVINQAAVQALQLVDPIGEQLVWHLDGYQLEVTVVGVVQNFHYKSLHESINPLIIQYRPRDFNHTVVKLEGKDFQQSIKAIEEIYSKTIPDETFEYHFLDRQLEELYQGEIRTLGVFSTFAFVALFLACLGLLGIALAMMSQKIKEVGIRKILGASPAQIVQMIFLQFAKLIGIALALGLPLSYLIMQEWLNEFPYQATLGVMPFVWSVLLLLLVAVTSVSVVVAKIAATNPVNTLRYE